MAKPRSVIDLLAEQPEEVLRQMREVTRADLARLQAEVARLTVEAEQIEQALTKIRRNTSPTRGTITGEQVLAAIKQLEPPFTAAEVQSYLATAENLSATVNAVRNHLNRLVERGELTRSEEGYVVPPVVTPEFVPSAVDDDIPF